MGRKVSKRSRKFDPQAGWGDVVGVALRQHGTVAYRQLTEAGLSSPTIQRYLAIGWLHRLHHGVYSLIPPPLLSRNGRYMAAVLACGRSAALSHDAAATLRGLMNSGRTRIDVTVPTRGGRARRGIQIHRSVTLRRNDVQLVEGIPCTTLARTVLDLAESLTNRRLERLLDEAAYREVLDFTALNEQIDHSAGRSRAVGNLRRALDGHRPGSTLTDGLIGEAMLELIRATPGLSPPKVQHYIDLHDGEPMIQADFAWPEARLILETDGAQAHGKPRRRRADYRRDQRAARAGWHTVRVDWHQIKNDRRRLSQTLLELVRSRSGFGDAA